MNTVFIDTNVYLDLLLARKPYDAEAREIFLFCEAQQISGYTSSSSISNIAYVLGKELGTNKVRPALRYILSLTDIVEADKHSLMLAVNSQFRDVEDAMQHFAALRIKGIDFLITRNVRDFKHSLIPVLSPTDFLHHLKNSE